MERGFILEITIENKFDKRYLVISEETGSPHLKQLTENDPSNEGEYNYIYQVILENKIKNIIGFELKQEGTKQSHIYNITSLVSLKEFYADRTIGAKELYNIFRSLAEIIEKIKEFLIPIEAIMLTPEMIFMDIYSHKLFFVVYPVNFTLSDKRLIPLAELLACQVDYKDNLAVNAAYGFYEMASKNVYSVNTFIENFFDPSDLIETAYNTGCDDKCDDKCDGYEQAVNEPYKIKGYAYAGDNQYTPEIIAENEGKKYEKKMNQNVTNNHKNRRKFCTLFFLTVVLTFVLFAIIIVLIIL